MASLSLQSSPPSPSLSSSSSHFFSPSLSSLYSLSSPSSSRPLLWPAKAFKLKAESQSPVRCEAAAPNNRLSRFIKQLGSLLWGRRLPPALLVRAVRELWTSAWLVMMAQLAPSARDGAYRRPDSQFRNRPIVSHVANTPTPRYHLYVSLTCPWAHRAIIVHTLKGLEDAVPLSVAVAGSSGLWEFHAAPQNASRGIVMPTVDKANSCTRLGDVYRLQKGGYNGRATVPMLWDSVRKEVVNNESADIIQILNSDFNAVAKYPDVDLAPKHLTEEIERWNDIIYPNVNNGVYKCGFAQSQAAYEVAVKNLFSTLDHLDEHLSKSRYLCGDILTLADIRLFTTLFRFDAAYHVLFKCSKKKISEYKNLYGYLQDLYQIPRVSSTCDLQAIMDGYYKVLFPLNPGGICPLAPTSSESSLLLMSHGREKVICNAFETIK